MNFSLTEIGAIAAILATVLGIFRIFAGFSTKKDLQEIKTNVEAVRVQAAATNGRTGRLEEWRTLHEKQSDADHAGLDALRLTIAALVTPAPGTRRD